MKSASFFAFSMLLAATVAMSLGLTGCTPKKPPDSGTGKGNGSPTPADGTPKTAIKAGTATIKGKVVLSGDMPTYTMTDTVAKNDQCKKCTLPAGREKDFGEYEKYMHANQVWIVGSDKGVANVLVRLQLPKNKYFEPSDEDKKRDKDVEIDQPCCAFIPHVVALYPSYYDGKAHVKTGQQLRVKNSAAFNHNTKIKGDERKGNFHNYTLSPKDEKKVGLTPTEQIDVVCDVHPMMNAILFVYDHPYAVVTKEDGAFELKNVPVGTEITVELWHESKNDVFEKKTFTLAEKEVKDLGTITISK